jgi:hypothetical protein
MLAPLLLAATLVTSSAPNEVPQLAGYSDCAIRYATSLDNGAADTASVARAVAARCEHEYRDWLAFMTRKTQLRAFLSNYDLALATVETQREYRKKR